jgi:hypothetical protein
VARRLLDAYGTRKIWWHDQVDGKIAIEEEDDCSEALFIAKHAGDCGSPLVDTDGMRLQRIMPAHVVSRAMSEGWFHDRAAIKRWANSEEGMAFAIEHNGRKQTL